MLKKKAQQKTKPQIFFKKPPPPPPPESRSIYEIMWKLWYSQAGHRWQYKTGHALCVLDTQGYTHIHTHTLRICNTFLFHGNNVCTNAPQYYFRRTLLVILNVTAHDICHCALEGEVFRQTVVLHDTMVTHDKSNGYKGEGQNSKWRPPCAPYVRAERSVDPIPIT